MQLTSTLATRVVSFENKELDWGSVDLDVVVKLCCPEIIAVKVEKFITCRSCRKKIQMTKEEKIVSCGSCKRKMFSGKCPFNCNCEVTAESEGKQINLTISPEFIKNCDIDETNIEEELHTSEKLDITYNNKKKIRGPDADWPA